MSGNDWRKGWLSPFEEFDPFGVKYLGRPTVIETGPLPIRIHGSTARQQNIGASHIHQARVLMGMVPIYYGEAGYQRFRRLLPDGTVIMVTSDATVDGAPPVRVADIFPPGEKVNLLHRYFERQRAPFLWIGWRPISQPNTGSNGGQQYVSLCGWEPEWEDDSHQFIGLKSSPEGHYVDDGDFMLTEERRAQWPNFFRYKPPLFSGPSRYRPHSMFGLDGGLYLNDVQTQDDLLYDPAPDEHQWEPGLMMDPMQGFGFTNPPEDGYPPEARPHIDDTEPFDPVRWNYQFGYQIQPRDARDVWYEILRDGPNVEENKLICIGKPKRKKDPQGPWYMFKFHFNGIGPDGNWYPPTYYGPNPYGAWRVQVKVVAGKHHDRISKVFDLTIRAPMHGCASHQFWPGWYRCTREPDGFASVTDQGANTGVCFDANTIEVFPWGGVKLHTGGSLRPWGI